MCSLRLNRCRSSPIRPTGGTLERQNEQKASIRHPTRWKVYGPASERGQIKRSPQHRSQTAAEGTARRNKASSQSQTAAPEPPRRGVFLCSLRLNRCRSSPIRPTGGTLERQNEQKASIRHPTRWKVYGPASERGQIKRSPQHRSQTAAEGTARRNKASSQSQTAAPEPPRRGVFLCSLRLNRCRSSLIRPTGGTLERQNAQKPVPDTSQTTPEDVQQRYTRTSHTGTPAFCSSMHFLHL